MSLLAFCSPSNPQLEEQGQLFIPIRSQNELEPYFVSIYSFVIPTSAFSTNCDLILRHFFCFYGYGVCDDTKTLQWTRESCQLLTEDLCVKEWKLLQSFFSTTGLPMCEDLPESADHCEGNCRGE